MRREKIPGEATVSPNTFDLEPGARGLDNCDFETILLAIAGHDLRQPLQILQMVHDRFGNDARTSSELRLLRTAQEAINRLREQLDQLLNALRLREKAGPTQLSPIALGPLLAQICRENEEDALQKGVELLLVPTTVWIMSDTFLLRVVLRNLINNAIRYTDPGGRILLGCRHGRDYLRVEIIDTGVGIPAERLPGIFDAFTRLSMKQRGGLGIGLFIVRKVIAMLGHRLDVSSVTSRGTRFSILAQLASRQPEV